MTWEKTFPEHVVAEDSSNEVAAAGLHGFARMRLEGKGDEETRATFWEVGDVDGAADVMHEEKHNHEPESDRLRVRCLRDGGINDRAQFSPRKAGTMIRDGER